MTMYTKEMSRMLLLVTTFGLTASSVAAFVQPRQGLLQKDPLANIVDGLSSTLVAEPSTAVVPASASWGIRRAIDSDIPAVIDFIEQKCVFDRSLNGEPESKLGVPPGETLQSLFPELPHARVLFAECGVEGGNPTGYASFNLKYSGFGPPMLWLEDVYVDQSKRSRGAGKALMDELASIAEDHSCTHLGWKADERNIRGLGFYDRLGAKITAKAGPLYSMEWVPEQWSK